MRLQLPTKFSLLAIACAFALAACGDSSRSARPATTRDVTPGAERAAWPPSAARGGYYKVGTPYQIDGIWYYPKVDFDYIETGIASWYGPGFHGRDTANGEVFDAVGITAAHRTLPMPSMVRVTNLDNGRSLVVRVNDRGPFKKGRIIDLSRRSAQLLGFEHLGTAKVRVEILEDESRQVAAVAQGQDTSIVTPRAAPTVAVAAVPLDATPSSTSASPTGKKTFEAAGRPAMARTAGVSRDGPPRPPGLWRHRREMVVASVTDRALQGAPTRQLAALPSAQLDDDPSPEPSLSLAGLAEGVVSQSPVVDSQIFIQAGSFLRRDYATRLSTILSGLGPSKVTQVQVNNRWFFRVRLGPIAAVEQADSMLDQLHNSGVIDAHIIVE